MDDGVREAMEAWFEAACEKRFWTELNPELKLEAEQVGPLFTVDEDRRHELWNDLLTDGYFELPPTLPSDQVARMARAMLRLDAEEIPMVFGYVYDEFWNLSGHLSGLLESLLAPGFRMLPDFWAWCIHPEKNEKGWHPHRDKGFETLLPNGLPRSLSIWVPLTDATTHNGCMYILPASRDPHYLKHEGGNDVSEVQEVRALPAKAGAVLGWNQCVLHWGSRATDRADGPRVSFSIEYQRADSPPLNHPLLDPAKPPPFEQRLALIGKQILQYQHMYDVGPELTELARRLTERFPLPA
jgi:hypothetical protein